MVGYAVGEAVRPKPNVIDDVEDSGVESAATYYRHQKGSCYEVVTAWVHPRYKQWCRNHGGSGGWCPRGILGKLYSVKCESLDTYSHSTRSAYHTYSMAAQSAVCTIYAHGTSWAG